MPAQAPHERLLIRQSEADPDVVHYVSQPHRLEMFLTDGSKLVYFPDLMRELSNGRTEIIETKMHAGEFAEDPAYTWKLELAEAVYASEGYQFRKMVLRELKARPTADNALQIWKDRTTTVSSHDRLLLNQQLHQSGASSTYADVINALGKGRLGQARLNAMLVRRLVWIDIHQVITPETPVRALEDDDHRLDGGNQRLRH